MNPGSMNKRIIIQKKTSIADKDGYKQFDWVDYHPCWCEINNLYGKELYEAMAVKKENTLNCKVRYCKALENLNTKDFRIVEKKDDKISNIFNIIFIDYLKFSKEKIIIKALEVI